MPLGFRRIRPKSLPSLQTVPSIEFPSLPLLSHAQAIVQSPFTAGPETGGLKVASPLCHCSPENFRMIAGSLTDNRFQCRVCPRAVGMSGSTRFRDRTACGFPTAPACCQEEHRGQGQDLEGSGSGHHVIPCGLVAGQDHPSAAPGGCWCGSGMGQGAADVTSRGMAKAPAARPSVKVRSKDPAAWVGGWVLTSVVLSGRPVTRSVEKATERSLTLPTR